MRSTIENTKGMEIICIHLIIEKPRTYVSSEGKGNYVYALHIPCRYISNK